VVLLDDELAELRRDPLHSGTQDDVLPTYILLTAGTSSVPVWRQDFSSLALSVWDSGADVWVSKNLLGPQPTADMAWVEGDDKRISWQDIYQVFSQLEINPSVASPDGFALLSASSKNHTFLNRFTRNTNSQSRGSTIRRIENPITKPGAEKNRISPRNIRAIWTTDCSSRGTIFERFAATGQCTSETYLPRARPSENTVVANRLGC
jgi:hypothetical protein